MCVMTDPPCVRRVKFHLLPFSSTTKCAEPIMSSILETTAQSVIDTSVFCKERQKFSEVSWITVELTGVLRGYS